MVEDDGDFNEGVLYGQDVVKTPFGAHYYMWVST
jgi:hypothetical protein